jgi:hypothetical protein
MKKLLLSMSLLMGLSVYFISCSKPDNTPAAITCADKTIVVSATTTPTSGGTTTNGAVNAAATGSTGFTYSNNGGAFQASGNFTNLAAGAYTITAKDDAGCTSSKLFNVTSAACPAINLTAVTTQATNATAVNGAVNATATGSTGFTYSNNGGAFQASGNFTGLAVGSYSITAKDVNGCTTTVAFTVTAATCPTIGVTNVTTQTAGPSATNGSVTATASGGLAPYTYAINAGAFQSSNIFGNLAVGNFTIVAKDANGCTSASTAVSITAAACPTINISNAIVGAEACPTTNVGSVTVTATGSTNLMYRINAGTYQTSNMFTGLGAGAFTIDVKDGNGCVATSTGTVNVNPAGPKFTAVKNLLATSCATPGCHSGAFPQSGYNFTDDCTIVASKVRINARAVVQGNMPASGTLPASEKQKITDWINAGGLRSN